MNLPVGKLVIFGSHCIAQCQFAFLSIPEVVDSVVCMFPVCCRTVAYYARVRTADIIS